MPKRIDGKKIKDIDGFFRMAAMFVGRERVDSCNYMFLDIPTKHMDEWIEKKKQEGFDYYYRDIIIAALVRVFYLRPRLNRFIMNGNFYQRNNIVLSQALHKNLKTGEQETTCKVHLTGKETIAEIKAAWETSAGQAIHGTNATDAFTGGFLGRMPTWALRTMVNMYRWGDKYGWLPRKFIEQESPFHASIWFTDMKSLSMGAHLHHLYNFGTVGLFCCIGKDEVKPYVDPDTKQLRAEKCITLGISEDERFIDGLTFAKVLKMIYRILDNLSCLEIPPDDEDIIQPVNSYQMKKDAAKQAKLDKKAAKKNKKNN